MIDLEYFKRSIIDGVIPDHLPLHLESLWHDGKGDWKSAHDLIDHLNDRRSAHVHAYLHRKEGDLWNADYWYSKAGQKRPDYTLENEWERLTEKFLTEEAKSYDKSR